MEKENRVSENPDKMLDAMSEGTTKNGLKNGYSLTKIWFQWVFENPRRSRPVHGLLFLWCVEKSNRLGWPSEFQLPTDEACAACSVADKETILKAISDLEAWGFIKSTRQPKNRFTSRWMMITADQIQTTLHPEKSDATSEYHPEKPDATPEYHPEKSAAIPDATPLKPSPDKEDSSPKLLNYETKEYILPDSSNPDRDSNPGLIKSQESIKPTGPGFDEFWNLYDKKVGCKAKLIKKWEKLSVTDREDIMAYIPAYIDSTPDKRFRLNPQTFLNNRGWEDEIIEHHPQKKTPVDLKTMKYEPGF